MLISIIVPTKNEEKNIRLLLDTLIKQEKPIEIIIVDAESKDNTQKIIKKYIKKYDFIKLLIKGGKRGKSMNYAINKAKGDFISFIGADDRAHENWIKYIRRSVQKNNEIIAGKCITEGNKKFELERVELYYKGFDISVPGTNTTYRKDILDNLKGFDTHFVTAEDIDLNLRAVEANYKIYYEDKAIVYRSLRENLIDFIKQSFWNGYGRKQLSIKHGKLWQNYSIDQTLETQLSIIGIIRLFFGFTGYLSCKISGGNIRN